MPENSGKPSKPKFTSEEKAQIYALFQQGLSHQEIAQRMGCDNAQRISGVVRAGLNFDKIPGRKQYLPPKDGQSKFPDPSSVASVAAQLTQEPAIQMGGTPTRPPAPPPPQLQESVQTEPVAPQSQMAGAAPALQSPPQAPVHQFVPRQAPPRPAVSQNQGDSFSSAWTPEQNLVEGFNQTALATRYVIYRDEPADGLLGEESSPFDELSLSRKYGRGLYRIQRLKTGALPMTTTVRVSEAFGEPKFPRRETTSTSAQRPNYSRWGRPWARSQESQEEEGRPLERPPLYDYARHPAPSSDAAAEAIRQIGQINLKTLEMNEAQRRNGPDAYMAKFLSEQQEAAQKRYEEQRRADEDRRKDDDLRWERRQKEADQEHRRRQEEETQRHARELEKIRVEAEARTKEAELSARRLMELEGQKLKVVEEQNRAREDALKEELKRNREQVKEQQVELKQQLKEMQQDTAMQIQSSQERLEKELQREREQLEREHKLKEKALDKERELEGKVLEIKSSQIEAQGTNEIVGVVNNLINKFSGSLNQVLELKKIEAAATPETQAAIVMKGQQNAATEAQAAAGATPAQRAAAANAAATPQDQTKTAAAPQNGKPQEINMRELVRDMVDKPFFKQVIEEWSLHVKTKQNGTTFVNMYREWMCDPNDHDGRKATTMFAAFIEPREWEDFYDVIKDKLDKKVQTIFETPHAKVFYETFRSLITEQIRAFWEEFGQQRDAINAARVAAGTEVSK